MTVKYRAGLRGRPVGATWEGCALVAEARLLGRRDSDGEDTRAVKGSEWPEFVFKRVF